MKKLVTTLLMLLACHTASALPLGNPSEASLLCDGVFINGGEPDYCRPYSLWGLFRAWRVRIGFYGDYVFNRHLQVDPDNNGRDIDNFEIYTNSTYFAATFCNRYDIFFTLGASSIFLETEGIAFSNARTPVSLQTSSEFAWSVGGRITLLQCGCTTLGIEGQYFSTFPEIKYFTATSNLTDYPSSIDLEYGEWQVGLGVSHRIWNLVPYAGVRYACAKADFSRATLFLAQRTFTFFDLQSKHSWGYSVGTSLLDCERAAVTIEGRFPDEKALYVNGQFRW